MQFSRSLLNDKQMQGLCKRDLESTRTSSGTPYMPHTQDIRSTTLLLVDNDQVYVVQWSPSA